MKKHLSVLVIILFGLIACEKPVFDEEKKEEKKTETVSTGESSPAETGDGGGTYNVPLDTASLNSLTVAEAIEATIGENIWVRGYIVASTTRSMKNIDFLAPFDGSTAIVLCDVPFTMDNSLFDSDDYLFPVCLTESKTVRKDLNLEDNPEIWNHIIYIYGEKSRYMSMPGLKKVAGYYVE